MRGHGRSSARVVEIYKDRRDSPPPPLCTLGASGGPRQKPSGSLSFTGSNHQHRRSLYVAVLHIAQGAIRVLQSIGRRSRLNMG